MGDRLVVSKVRWKDTWSGDWWVDLMADSKANATVVRWDNPKTASMDCWMAERTVATTENLLVPYWAVSKAGRRVYGLGERTAAAMDVTTGDAKVASTVSPREQMLA